jgi:pheromone shutdown protein TraB
LNQIEIAASPMNLVWMLEQDRNSRRLTILGTTHVDKLSIERVRRTISETRPSVVAVELDEERLLVLRDPDRGKLDSPIRSGLLPWMMILLERSVGSLTGVFPGSEMLEAVDEAEKVGARTILIDKRIESILEEIRDVPLLEKLKISLDVLAALFAISTKRKTAQSMKAGLDDLLAEFGAKYPALFRILVTERDRYMADRLQEILDSTTGQVIAVVGSGHVTGITQHLAMNRQVPSTGHLRLKYEWTLRSFP